MYTPISLYYALLFIIRVRGGGRTNRSRKSNLNSDRKRAAAPGLGGAWLIRTGRLKFKRRVRAGHKTMPKTNSIRNRARDGYSSARLLGGGGTRRDY